MRCTRNLNPLVEFLNFFTLGSSEKDTQYSVECLLVSNLIGIITTPGAHMPLQFWYAYSIPLLLQLLPLSSILTFSLYLGLFPAVFAYQSGANYHHLFLIILVIWHVFFGWKRKEIKQEVDQTTKIK